MQKSLDELLSEEFLRLFLILAIAILLLAGILLVCSIPLTISTVEVLRPACVRSNGETFEVKDLKVYNERVRYVTMNDNVVEDWSASYVFLDDTQECSYKLFQ